MKYRNAIIGMEVSVIIDRPLGSAHPEHKDMLYTVNYGYIRGIKAGDGEWQDCYVLGQNEPIKRFNGIVVTIIKRKNDAEDKWIVAKKGAYITNEQILEETAFQEQYFDIELIR